MTTQPTSHVTRMIRCKVCGMAFPSGYQIVAAPIESDYVESDYVEACPAGHICEYAHTDYYLA
jgi:hypothetical protein